jgi:hypothetical protein
MMVIIPHSVAFPLHVYAHSRSVLLAYFDSGTWECRGELTSSVPKLGLLGSMPSCAPPAVKIIRILLALIHLNLVKF